ncbi:MAG TPA: metallophosphoesterase [Candidatus Tumulicola sp.]|nr:metallophosphoesterase [Candidatus Tumulicola sp.]
MRLHVMSDLHLEKAPIEPFSVRGDVLVLAGDIDTRPGSLRDFLKTFPGDLPVITILGNHEFDCRVFSEVLPMYREALAPLPNVHLLENQSVEVGGVTFLGCTLWSDMARGAEAPAIARLLQYFEMKEITVPDLMDYHQHSVDWLRASYPKGKRAVVVTHMAPSLRSVKPRYAGSPINGFFASDLEPLIAELGPPLWIHGHMHDAMDYEVGATRIVCNPRGYPEENPRWTPDGVLVDVPD